MSEEKALQFEFTKYTYEPEQKRAVFTYTTTFGSREPLVWTETLTLPAVPTNAVPEKLLESLHIILGISYWKFYCATNIKLPYALSKAEAEFWNTVYKKGLGEFFYQNKLDPKISPKFKVTSNQKPVTSKLRVTGYSLPVTDRSLVGVGGGKDSIVAIELLKQHGFDITGFVVESKASAIIDEVIKIAQIPDLKISRQLDPKVSQPHPYNGHIPISAIYAFLGVFSCIAYGYKSFIVANEHSSNFGNIKYKGLEINHQWSKSLEFERLFQNFIHNSINKDVDYFSLLRPFYEIRIVKMFAKYPQYFSHFSSCNRNFSSTRRSLGGGGQRWCCQCAKCVFAWAMLSASLSKKDLLDIFGKDLSKEKSVQPLFDDITGRGSMKPFDCVGTFEEAQEALGIKSHPEVWQTQKSHAIPEQFKFAIAEKAIILGYGKEGKTTKQYLKKKYPKLKVGVGDGALNKNYLAEQKNYDIAVKTPGLHKSHVTIPYTTATNIFFSQVKGKNIIIGVTGSKGKSTTSSLIYHILKTAGKDVELLGNIGKPMLEALLATNYSLPTTHYVLELSSYQLDDIEFSPDIAVVTNLFPEHLDFHGNLKNYYAAKKNIINFQTPENYFVHNKKTASWLKDYQGKPVKFSTETFESNLIGAHNQSNMQAAAAVAEILSIPKTTIKEAMKTFKGLEHRLENVGTFHGITFYDDAISTTPESTIEAIKALKTVDTIFLGGQDRGYDFIQLEKVIKKYKIKNIVLFPDSGKRMLKSTKGLNMFKTDNMEEAVKFAYKNTAPGKICLLSCASPSYSLWENFEEKGNQFKFFVKKLS